MVIGAHDATVQPTFSGYARIDFGTLIPQIRVPAEAPLGLGVDIRLGDSEITNLDQLVARDAAIAAQPQGEIASVRSALILDADRRGDAGPRRRVAGRARRGARLARDRAAPAAGDLGGRAPSRPAPGAGRRRRRGRHDRRAGPGGRARAAPGGGPGMGADRLGVPRAALRQGARQGPDRRGCVDQRQPGDRRGRPVDVPHLGVVLRAARGQRLDRRRPHAVRRRDDGAGRDRPARQHRHGSGGPRDRRPGRARAC